MISDLTKIFRCLSLKRAFFADQNINEYSLIRYKGKNQKPNEKPLTSDEYKEMLSDGPDGLKLRHPVFCVLQDRLFSSLLQKENLTDIIEQLSESSAFAEEYSSLKEQKNSQEAVLRELSDQLKNKRQEKIKMRGLSDYQK